ncbi:MAG: Fic family protein [Ignavibacteria bacterium]
MSFLNKEIQVRIDKKLNELAKLRPIQSSLVNKLREQFALEMTYNSNAIEGNSLTQKETFLVINEGLTIKGKSFKDHLEVKDHYEALEYLHEFMRKDKKQTFTEVTLRAFHHLVLRETESKEAGKYRTGNVIITGSAHNPPEAYEVPAKMRELFEWIRRNKNKIHIIEMSAIVHHKISFIHPFADGNGRTARLIMNLLLMQKGFPMVVILNNDRKKYYDTLSKADKGEYVSFVRFIAQAAERSLNIYLKALAPAKLKSKKFFPLSQIAKQTPYSEKYLNLLSRLGKIEAHKEGRNWVTSLDAIKKYREERERKR